MRETQRGLGAMLAASSEGFGGIALIRGPMATGKTGALSRFLKEADQSGALVRSALASREEQNLPFGVVEQLLRGQTDGVLPAKYAMDDYHNNFPFSSNDRLDSMSPQSEGSETYLLGRELLALTNERPVVLAVDDAQHIDVQSLHCILFAARRLHHVRMVLALTGHCCAHYRCQRFFTEISRLPDVRCHNLSWNVQELAELLAEQFGESGSLELAFPLHELSGGNLLLANGLIEDYRSRRSDELARLQVGRAYCEAVLACVHRCEPEAVAVIQAMAVLRELATPELIGSLLNTDAESVAATISALELDGLLAAGKFRHPAAAAAIRRSLTPAERGRANQLVAQLMHERGASSSVVARHVIESGALAEPWAAEVLLRAADELFADQPETSKQYLRAARHLVVDERVQATITTMLVSVEWRNNPAVAARNLPKLLDALDQGSLSRDDGILLIRYLLWHGRIDEAGEALERLLALESCKHLNSAEELKGFALWLSYWYPVVLERVPAAKRMLTIDITTVAVTSAPQLQAGNLVQSIISTGDVDEIVAAAEKVLTTVRLDDSTLDLVITALTALLHVDELDLVKRRCAAFLSEATVRGATTWQARLSHMSGVIAMRRGDLAVAVEHAEAALESLEPRHWGIELGWPLATLAYACTAMGDHERAAVALAEPVPTEMFQTCLAPYYWQARGRHYLAVGRLGAALADFNACGAFMIKWGVDRPDLLPWRSDLAELYLCQGRPSEARALAEEQVAMLPCQVRRRARGIALRLLAEVSVPRERPALLGEAIQHLRSCGAELELAYAFAALARAYHELHEPDRARTTELRAQSLAARCKAAIPVRFGLPRKAPADAEVSEDPGLADSLSAAEVRVAALAVQGLTNGEIARNLYLTVSTVEQHLTRTYRKLKVRGRMGLPANIHDFAAKNLPTCRPLA
jgi:DNA-binding CsgD family transcriptional regulator